MIVIEADDHSALKEGAPCLHCLLTGIIQSYWMQFGVVDENSGAVGFDVPLTVANLAEAMANIIMRVEAPAAREKLIGDAHAVLDGVLKAMQTGEEVEMNIGGPGVVH